MPKKETGAPAAPEQPDFIHMTVPRGFAHPYSFTDQNGREWNKAIINIPPGTKANGIDLTGYSLDTFLNSFQMGQIASNEPLSVSMREGNKVELFKGKGDERQTILVDPWALTSAMKENREAFAQQKAQERKAEQKQEPQKEDKVYSLASEQKEANKAKEQLAELGELNRQPQIR